jgi:hypothetical protein
MSEEPWLYVVGTTGLTHAVHFRLGSQCDVWPADIGTHYFMKSWNELPILTDDIPLTCLWCAARWTP